jgi:exodeoxyribonuclease VII large subunit
VTRGGGSEEDLSAFNDERVVRKIGESPVPTIAAIGHEINWSLVDLAADMRVSTPTAAAEKVALDYIDLLDNLAMTSSLITQKVRSLIDLYREKIATVQSRPWFKDPSQLYQKQIELLTNKQEKINLMMTHQLATLSQEVEQRSQSLIMLNPQGVLKRGYAMVTNETGEIVSSISQVQEGTNLKTRLSDGIITSTVKKKEN